MREQEEDKRRRKVERVEEEQTEKKQRKSVRKIKKEDKKQKRNKGKERGGIWLGIGLLIKEKEMEGNEKKLAVGLMSRQGKKEVKMKMQKIEKMKQIYSRLESKIKQQNKIME